MLFIVNPSHVRKFSSLCKNKKVEFIRHFLQPACFAICNTRGCKTKKYLKIFQNISQNDNIFKIYYHIQSSGVCRKIYDIRETWCTC